MDFKLIQWDGFPEPAGMLKAVYSPKLNKFKGLLFS